ncbi:hypothetical protein R2R70_23075 [Cobetia sp. SIMBA_158]|uniref:hypothetical protein n=1 Tax=Cobetia sp. SIMBA_158 TaxID=3081617 RepID=UPI00397EFB8E
MAPTQTRSHRVRSNEDMIELVVAKDVARSPRYNEDIASTKSAERPWLRWNIAALWVGV